MCMVGSSLYPPFLFESGIGHLLSIVLPSCIVGRLAQTCDRLSCSFKQDSAVSQMLWLWMSGFPCKYGEFCVLFLAGNWQMTSPTTCGGRHLSSIVCFYLFFFFHSAGFYCLSFFSSGCKYACSVTLVRFYSTLLGSIYCIGASSRSVYFLF
jgi:hypothetical protein